MNPRTRYARSDDVCIAYQVTGDGPIDVVMAPGTMSHLDMAPRHSGRLISMTLSPLAHQFRHRKFEKPKMAYVEDVGEGDDDDDDPESHRPHLHTLSMDEILVEMEEDNGRPKKRG